jgi:hypothetical protein
MASSDSIVIKLQKGFGKTEDLSFDSVIDELEETVNLYFIF